MLLAGPVAAALGIGALGVLLLLRRRARSRRSRRQTHSDVTDACLALAAEFAAGAPTMSALHTVSVDWPELFATAAGQAATGGDPVRALRQTAERPGAEALAAVAAAWEVSERTGARLGTALVAVADAIRADDAVRREADAQLGMVRATARLLALLPVATLALFSAGAGDPVGFLVGTGYGLACLAAALVLVGTGMLWVDRTARVTTRSAWQ
jgi:tight adherence protein B